MAVEHIKILNLQIANSNEGGHTLGFASTSASYILGGGGGVQPHLGPWPLAKNLLAMGLSGVGPPPPHTRHHNNKNSLQCNECKLEA